VEPKNVKSRNDECREYEILDCSDDEDDKNIEQSGSPWIIVKRGSQIRLKYPQEQDEREDVMYKDMDIAGSTRILVNGEKADDEIIEGKALDDAHNGEHDGDPVGNELLLGAGSIHLGLREVRRCRRIR
jgi:hypothetical protein